MLDALSVSRTKAGTCGGHLAACGLLIIAGEPDALERFRATAVTFHVFNLDDAIAAATKGGAVVLQQRSEVPTGAQARVKTPDGLTIELVEHNEAAKRFYNCNDIKFD